MSVNTDFCKINNFSKTLSIQEFPNYVANVIFETFFNAPHFLSAIEDDFSVSRNNKTLEFIDAFVITEKYHGFHDLYIKTYNDKHDEDFNFLEYKKYRNTQHGDIAIMNEHFAKDPEYQKFKKRVFMAFCNDKI